MILKIIDKLKNNIVHTIGIVNSYKNKYINHMLYMPKTKKFDCLSRGDLTFLFFLKAVK